MATTSVSLSEQQASALRMFHWLVVVGTTTRGGVIVRSFDDRLRVLSRAGYFHRFRGQSRD